jgi:hypothetical protein
MNSRFLCREYHLLLVAQQLADTDQYQSMNNVNYRTPFLALVCMALILLALSALARLICGVGYSD